jgi:hypothetical protein
MPDVLIEWVARHSDVGLTLTVESCPVDLS